MKKIGWRVTQDDDDNDNNDNEPCHGRRMIPPSCRYMHWCCVSGSTIKDSKRVMRRLIQERMDWSKLGVVLGGTLDQATKEKAARVIEQEHVDPDGCNGGPAYSIPTCLTIYAIEAMVLADRSKATMYEARDEKGVSEQSKWEREQNSKVLDSEQPPRKSNSRSD